MPRVPRWVLGGGVNGRYVEPTILTGVTPDMQIYQFETFGPVVPVIPFRTDEEAVAIANDTDLRPLFGHHDLG